MDSRKEKSSLRKLIKQRIAAIPSDERQKMDKQIAERLADFLAESNLQTIIAYIPMQDEVGFAGWLKEYCEKNGELLLPRMRKDGELDICRIMDFEKELSVGQFGVREPCQSIPVCQVPLDCSIIVPGRAFSLGGQRLGRGKGYYDRLLAKIGESANDFVAPAPYPLRGGVGWGKSSSALPPLNLPLKGGENSPKACFRRIALAYECQIVDHIPVERHDEKVDVIITEERTVFCE